MLNHFFSRFLKKRSEDIEKVRILNEAFLKLVVEKQIIKNFFRRFLGPNHEIDYYYSMKQNNIMTHNYKRNFFKSVNKESQIKKIPERPWSTCDKTDILRKKFQSLKLENDFDELPTKIEIRGSFVQEKFDKTKETVFN